jgi:hypothetical protein
MVRREELPIEIGLIWYDPDTKSLSVKKKPPPRKIEISSDMLLYIIYSRLESDRIPFYSDRTEYWRAWLENKRNNEQLGCQVRSKLLEEIKRLERELATANRYGREGEREEYARLRKVMEAHGLTFWDHNPDKWLEGRLAQEYPKALDDVQQRLEWAIEEIKKAKEAAHNDTDGKRTDYV